MGQAYLRFGVKSHAGDSGFPVRSVGPSLLWFSIRRAAIGFGQGLDVSVGTIVVTAVFLARSIGAHLGQDRRGITVCHFHRLGYRGAVSGNNVGREAAVSFRDTQGSFPITAGKGLFCGRADRFGEGKVQVSGVPIHWHSKPAAASRQIGRSIRF